MKKKKTWILIVVISVVILTAGILIGKFVISPEITKSPLEEKQEEIYKLAQESGFNGTYEEWLETIKGVDGTSITNVEINNKGELVITLSTGEIKNLGSIKGETGSNGKEVEFKVENGYLKWQYVGENNWKDLIALSKLQGEQGAAGDDGSDGKEIELKVEDGYLKWQYVGENNWKNLIFVESLKGSQGLQGPAGKDGKEVEFKVENGYLKWQYVGDNNWKDLLSLSSLQGSQGETGSSGEPGKDGKEIELKVENGYLKWQYVGENNWKNLISLSTLVGANGQNGNDGLSAYEIYLKYHPDYHKTEEEWLEDLVNGALVDETKYTVKFMVEETTYKIVSVLRGTKVAKPEDPTKSGYTFVGWFDENDDKWVFNGYDVDLDLTLHAKFEYDYSIVTFNSQGGIIPINEAKYTYGENVTLPTPSKTGYTFDGWFNGETKVESGSWQYTENITLVAKYTGKQYTVTLNANGGVLNEESTKVVTYGEKFQLPACGENETVPFAGWYYQDEILTDEYGESKDIWLIDKNVTLIAEYFVPIYNAEDLQNINNNLTTKYRLMNDIDLDGVEWTPIGGILNVFSGQLEGNNYTISNLYISQPSEYISAGYDSCYSGLFGKTNGSVISNLSIENFYISFTSTAHASKGKEEVGFLIAQANNTTIDNVSIFNSSLNIVDKATDTYIGGIIGNTNGCEIKNSSVQAEISATSGLVGGVVGNNVMSTIFNVTTKVTISSSGSIGGIVGLANETTIIDKVNTTVKLSNGSQSGGIIGYVYSANVKRAIAHGTINQKTGTVYLGSLIGCINGELSIERSVSDIDQFLVGCLAAGGEMTVTNCANKQKNYGIVNVIQDGNHAVITLNSSYCLFDKFYLKVSSNPAFLNIKNNNSLAIGSISDKSVLTKEYYMDTLGWSTQLWNFENLSEEGYILPTLKGVE